VLALVVIASCVLVGSTRLRAQWTVFDPTNYAEAIKQLVQLEHQYTELVHTYQLLAEQATRAPGDLDARYRSFATPWLALTAPDTYATTSGWVHTANTGHDTAVGYAQLPEPLRAYGELARVPADVVARLQRAYGGVELRDGITEHGLEMLGHLRAHAADVELALRRLEDDSFSGDPSLNTEVAVLNKVNAATVTSARLTKDTNQILLALLDEQLADARQRRDAQAIALNARIAFDAEARDLAERTSAGTAEALSAFRLP
jgi:hypothetical protein